ncbi:glycosyl transferase [Candidatus Methylospira mobilis]|uniref:Glycosyl transferase n=1 Tax=Candidatus Methylospira mobilis TaxID=1808979 RepID=A0A5Q0BLK8_9GAMM|nr:glycosyl transferase [Candidatus Methylospira mobilis]QFY43101.1 glycosyl transferase [Candidatus Methylospira mobilis]
MSKSRYPLPTARLLSNGHFTSLITGAGSGYCSYGEIALTRWSGDRVSDGDGYFLYLRDMDTGDWWSPGLQPGLRPPDHYRVDGDVASMRLERANQEIVSLMAVAVSPDDAVEVRSLTLSNRSERKRTLELTSLLDVVLNHPAADASHPAFSRLFIQTEHDAESGTLLAHRRPRAASETGLWMFHRVGGAGVDAGFETDRTRFIGRGHTRHDPAALLGNHALSGTAGNVLDPVFSMRRVVELEPGEQAVVVFFLGVAESRTGALAVAQRYADFPSAAPVFEQALLFERGHCAHLSLSEDQAAQFQVLAAAVQYEQPVLRAKNLGLPERFDSCAALARLGVAVSGPLLVVNDQNLCFSEAIALYAKLIAYWRIKGFVCTVLIFAEAPPGFISPDACLYVRSCCDIGRKDFIAILSYARLLAGTELEVSAVDPLYSRYRIKRPAEPGREQAFTPPSDLHFFNGYGGFSADGSEYVIRLNSADETNDRLLLPPLPWVNVVSNEHFGFLISETGAGYTWSRNSREYRLTPWSNDPLLDPHGEALYLRDEEDGTVWSPLPGPIAGAGAYQAAHGYGYSRFIHNGAGIAQETTVFVPRNDPVKIVRIRLTNNSMRTRSLSLFSFQQLLLGSSANDQAQRIETLYEDKLQVLIARQRYSGDFADGFVFCAVSAPTGAALHYSADREAFLGYGQTLSAPAALSKPVLDGCTGAGLDPCFAMQARLTLEAGDTIDCALLLGEAGDARQLATLLQRYRQPGAIAEALFQVQAFWRDTVGGLQVKTPVPAIDLMLNGWLTYQNLSCRLWGRSAFYQGGGAFGFRDQLQDSAALLLLRPDLTRKQILLNAAHQFEEGDVLHWWHPEPANRGQRTRFADDLLWLPWITATYISSTGDSAILNEPVGFISAPPLEPGEDENYLRPGVSKQRADVYEHCCRALDRSLTRGEHGLPLMGTGDWNDGMNRVGREGRGESVWMGFFLCRIISDFLPLCAQRGDSVRAERYSAYRSELEAALNRDGWDGEWYRRAYYDNGAVMGSKDSDECQIDALAQAWAVISGVAPRERGNSALYAVERQLLSDPPGLIRLLTPAFVDTPNDPGYIKGYVAGVRENGGQYTHAACWVVKALAEQRWRDKAAVWLQMLSPVEHALTADDVARYQTEPYVVAADIYGEEPHIGRGGWTWYTGSAGWLYRVGIESVLGFSVEQGSALLLKPCIPDDWDSYSLDYRLPGESTGYLIKINNPSRSAERIVVATLDGESLRLLEEPDGALRIPLQRDGLQHNVEITMGKGA